MANDLPRIRLLMGPGTLPSQGSGRLDFTRYRRSGRPRMTGQELLAALPEIASVARVEVDTGNPYEVATLEDVCKLAVRVNEIVQHPDVDGVWSVKQLSVPSMPTCRPTAAGAGRALMG